MKKCLIIGGGIAGLTTASFLTAKNIPVTLLESSHKFGGRTYSFIDSVTGNEIDNGQHILMGCYNYTLSLLRLIEAENNFIFQENLKLVFIDRDKSISTIDASKMMYPFNLFLSIFNYKALSSKEKIKFIGLLLKIPFISRTVLKKNTALEWLRNENQDNNAIKYFWEILCVGALNTSCSKASALVYFDVINKIFFGGKSASKIVLPKYGLSRSLVDPAFNFISNNGGTIIPSQTVKEFILKNQEVITVKTEKETFTNFDYVISAIPMYALEKIISKDTLDINVHLSYSTILNVHLWLKENYLKEEFYGLLNSPLHWIFNKKKYINIVVSDANLLASKDNTEILTLIIAELKTYFGIVEKNLLRYKIIKEKRATFLPDVKSNFIRPKTTTNIKNLFLAGDWIDTGLPATIESAAKSGYMAATQIIRNINNE